MEKETRSPEQLRRHYEVERELAQRLLKSTREQRTELFKTLYGELFARVPDHPRLVRRETVEATRRAVASRMSLLGGHLDGVETFLEFAPGDCTLAFEVCRHVKTVVGVDISDQTGELHDVPKNFRLVVYDGYQLNLPDNSVDLAYSYQFLEHLHPDDVGPHFEIIKRVLKPGGAYIFSTPHRFSGPHDISAHFSDTPQGFHFKEWTFLEMYRLARRLGFSEAYTYRFGKARCSRLVNGITFAVETVMDCLPRKLQKRLGRRAFEGVTMLLRK